jgi:hypothetical protein
MSGRSPALLETQGQNPACMYENARLLSKEHCLRASQVLSLDCLVAYSRRTESPPLITMARYLSLRLH